MSDDPLLPGFSCLRQCRETGCDIRQVLVSDLLLGGDYQLLRESRVRKLLRLYRPVLFRPIIVAERENGLLSIVDGVTRCEALIRMNIPRCHAIVIPSSGIVFEVRLWQATHFNRPREIADLRYREKLLDLVPEVCQHDLI